MTESVTATVFRLFQTKCYAYGLFFCSSLRFSLNDEQGWLDPSYDPSYGCRSRPNFYFSLTRRVSS